MRKHPSPSTPSTIAFRACPIERTEAGSDLLSHRSPCTKNINLESPDFWIRCFVNYSEFCVRAEIYVNFEINVNSDNIVNSETNVNSEACVNYDA